MAENLNGPLVPYLQIADTLRSEIRDGDYDDSGKLPPSRELIKRFGVTAQTISNAVRELRLEGLVTTSQRGAFLSATEVAAQGSAEATSDELDALTRLEAAVFRLEQRVAALEADRLQQEPPK